MKRWIIYTLFIGSGALALMSNSGGRATNGFGNTGAPGDLPATCQGCHNSTAIQVTVSVQAFEVGTTTAAASYIPGQAYDMRVTVNTAVGSPARFGFQMIGLRTANNTQAGVFSNPSSNAKLATANGGRIYAEHNGASTTNTFTVRWTAPAAGAGTVRFYAAGTGVNNNGQSSGDGGGATTFNFAENTTVNTNNLASQSLSFKLFPTLAQNELFVELEPNNDAFQLDIVGLDGRVISSQQVSDATNSIDVSQLNSGMYFVRLSQGNASTSKGFIKE
jgi:hypothetical protein